LGVSGGTPPDYFMKYLSVLFLFIFSSKIFCIEISEKKDSYYHFLQGLIYKEEANYLQAIYEFEKTLEFDKDAINVYKELILCYTAIHQEDKAVELAKKLQKISNDINVSIFLGEFYTIINDTQNAIINYKSVLEKDPENIEALLFLINIYYNIAPEESISYLQKYIRINPQSSEAYFQLGLTYIKLNKKDEAKKYLLEAVQKDKNNPAPLLALAQIYEYEKDFLNAIEKYEEYLVYNKDDIELIKHTGILYYIEKMFDKAEKKFLEALKISPDNDPSVYLWLALVYEGKNDWINASKYMEYKIKKSPDISSLLRMSYYYSNLGKIKKSIKILQKALKLQPNNFEINLFLGLGYMDIKKTRDAEKQFLKCIKIKADYPKAYFYLGMIYEQTNRFEKAIPQFKKVIQLEPNDHITLNYLGYSFADRNINLDEAEKLINKALELEPENPAYIDSLAWVYYRKGDLNKAREFLEKIKDKIKDSVIFEHLGDVERDLNNINKSIEYYKKSIELDEKNKKVKQKLNELIKKIK